VTTPTTPADPTTDPGRFPPPEPGDPIGPGDVPDPDEPAPAPGPAPDPMRPEPEPQPETQPVPPGSVT
jgi:hypothetical protein